MARALHVCTQCLKFENFIASRLHTKWRKQRNHRFRKYENMKASVCFSTIIILLTCYWYMQRWEWPGHGTRLLSWTVHCLDDDRVTLMSCFETVLARSRFGLFFLSNFLLVVQSDDITSVMPLKPQTGWETTMQFIVAL